MVDKKITPYTQFFEKENLSRIYVLILFGCAFLLPELQNLFRRTFIDTEILLVLVAAIFLLFGAVFYVVRGVLNHKDYILNACSFSVIFITVFLWVNYNMAKSDSKIEKYVEFEFGVQGRKRAAFGIPYFEIERKGLQKSIYFKEWDPVVVKTAQGIYIQVKEGYFGYDIIINKQVIN